jgi:hypothetical protein
MKCTLNIKVLYATGQTPEIHYRGGIILNQFDAIIPRIRPAPFMVVPLRVNLKL